MTTTFYQYPKCSTCRRAKRALDARGTAYASIDLVAQPPTKADLRSLWQRSGKPVRAFFNTSGESYRAGGFKDRLPTLSDDDALAALAADGKLVKRPILDTGKSVLVGYDETAWATV